MSLISQTLEIARVDLTVERRLGETFRVVLPFAVVSLLVFPIALGFRLNLVSDIGPAIYWALAVLFGMQVALRQSAADTPERRSLYALLGVDPAARFLGRTLSGSLLGAAFLLVMFLAMVLLYSPTLPEGSWPAALVSSVLLAVGITELGALAGEVANGLRNRTAIASLLVAPLSIPLVIGASQSLEALQRGSGILPWVLLMIATDLALAVAGIGLARPLDEIDR